jgi:hypothetical protein
MSFHAVYITADPPHYADGDHLATSRGWSDFGEFALAHAAHFPECAYLADGPVDEAVPGSLARLAAELPRLAAAARAAGRSDVAGVAESLARALAAKPANCVGIYASDGESNETGEEDAEPNQSNVYG